MRSRMCLRRSSGMKEDGLAWAKNLFAPLMPAWNVFAGGQCLTRLYIEIIGDRWCGASPTSCFSRFRDRT